MVWARPKIQAECGRKESLRGGGEVGLGLGKAEGGNFFPFPSPLKTLYFGLPWELL